MTTPRRERMAKLTPAVRAGGSQGRRSVPRNRETASSAVHMPSMTATDRKGIRMWPVP